MTTAGIGGDGDDGPGDPATARFGEPGAGHTLGMLPQRTPSAGGPLAPAPVDRRRGADEAGPEELAFDVAGPVGALLVHAPADRLGMAVEVAACDADGPRRTALVRSWSMNGVVITAAAFAALPKGPYRMWTGGQPQRSEVAVYGAYVSEVVWAPSALGARGGRRPARRW